MSLNAKLETAHGTIGMHVTGAGERPLPGIVLLHEIFGVNHAMELASETFARAGYVVAAPDLYHALAPGTALTYDPPDRPRALALWAKLRDEDAIRDIVAVQTWLRAHPSCNGRVALLGFCLGGKLTVLTAARAAPDCVISFYPVQLENHVSDINRVACPIQVHLGEKDTHVPPASRDIVRPAVCRKAENQFIIYPDAEHGFYNPIRPAAYHRQAAAEAHEASLQFLKRWLAVTPSHANRTG
jgi:carboxymethylenebutenolidase